MKPTSTRSVGRRLKTLRSPILVLAICAWTAPLLAQEMPTRTVEHSYQFDERGDAKLEISFQYGAAQWMKWKEQYGNHPDLLLRYLRHDLAVSVIDDFALDRDDIHRRAVAKIKARAVARYSSGGQFSVEMPKTMKLVTGSGTDWVFTGSALGNGEIVNQTTRFKLPAKAQNAHLTQGADSDRLVYTLQVTPARPKGWLELGIVLIIGAAGLGVWSAREGKPPTTPTSISGSAPPPNLPPTPPALPRPTPPPLPPN